MALAITAFVLWKPGLDSDEPFPSNPFISQEQKDAIIHLKQEKKKLAKQLEQQKKQLSSSQEEKKNLAKNLQDYQKKLETLHIPPPPIF